MLITDLFYIVRWARGTEARQVDALDVRIGTQLLNQPLTFITDLIYFVRWAHGTEAGRADAPHLRIRTQLLNQPLIMITDLPYVARWARGTKAGRADASDLRTYRKGKKCIRTRLLIGYVSSDVRTTRC